MTDGRYAGYLIYSGIMPLLKTFITIFLGWMLAWRGLFTPAASKGASELAVNIALPCLIFSNIVPAFTPQNVSALGPLFLLSFFYIFLGLIFGIIIRETCFVPRNFWFGIIVTTAVSNWGSLPNSIVLSVTENPPFDSSVDPALGVSYVSLFTVSSYAVFWIFGANVITWDYRPDVPQGQEETHRRVPWKEKPIGKYLAHIMYRSRRETRTTDARTGLPAPREVHLSGDEEKNASTPSKAEAENYIPPDADTSEPDQMASRPFTGRRRPSSRSSDILPSPNAASRYIVAIKALWVVIWGVINPITLSMIIALPIALIPPLKALFVDAAASGGPRFAGPDGNPPLAFIQDTAAFVGNVTVPLSLVLLGASFARMRRPSDVSQLPLPAIFAVTVAKLVILPVCGILLVQGLVARGLVSRESRAERFVGMLLSGTPSMINQVIVTQVCSPDGDISTLSVFFLVQYVCMFLSSATITAISLALVR